MLLSASRRAKLARRRPPSDVTPAARQAVPVNAGPSPSVMALPVSVALRGTVFSTAVFLALALAGDALTLTYPFDAAAWLVRPEGQDAVAAATKAQVGVLRRPPRPAVRPVTARAPLRRLSVLFRSQLAKQGVDYWF